ncbi:MAG: HAMP domain-containing histidine kinase [Williamsia sp.]|nr:HAMP domain-containing histidine kinase [Williamsia sp.]
MNRPLFTNALFMIITIAVIIGFQVYWLKDNYDREKKTLTIKTGIAFQEVVHKLQAVKLKLPSIPSGNAAQAGKARIFLDESQNSDGSMQRRKIITLVNNVRDKLQEGKKDSLPRSTVVLRMNGNSRPGWDSFPVQIRRSSDTGNHLLNVLYRVDSLQDSIRVKEIAADYAGALKRENLNIGYNVVRLAGTPADYETDMSKAVVGFAHPVAYQLLLTDTRSYLLKKISLPILFSVLLIGTTLFSFLILYRNLLRQRRLTEMKNEFISNISHELKTPIATVGVAIEALKSFHALDDPQKTREYLDISSNELQRLGLLVDKVLKLSLFERKQMQLNKESFDFKELIQEVLGSMKPLFNKQAAEVSFNWKEDDFMIQADKLHLTSVVYNLVDNALKYSGDAPRVQLDLSRQKDVFKLSVTDNGIGIEKEYRSKVFDKFFRVPTGNRHQVKGYGLGLSYVSEIIRRHMGYVQVVSEPGHGSSFIVMIPIEEKDIIWLDEKRSIRKKVIRLPAIKKT